MKIYDYEATQDYNSRTLYNMYSNCVDDIVRTGRKIGPRGKATLEINDVAIRFPQMCGTVSWKGRKLNPFFLLSEMLWIVSGADETSLLEPHMPSIVNFYDEGNTFGAYGPRFYNQLQGVVQTLKEDPDSRQAVMTFWRSDLYSPSGVRQKTVDVPCTVMMHFRWIKSPYVDSSSLNMTVYMRSNDMFKGFPYDVFNFGMIQAVVAALLRTKIGVCTHVVGSAHVYQDDLIHVMRRGNAIPCLSQPWDQLSKELAKFSPVVQDNVRLNLGTMDQCYRLMRLNDEIDVEGSLVPTGVELFDTMLKVLARRLEAPKHVQIKRDDIKQRLISSLLAEYYEGPAS